MQTPLEQALAWCKLAKDIVSNYKELDMLSLRDVQNFVTNAEYHLKSYDLAWSPLKYDDDYLVGDIYFRLLHMCLKLPIVLQGQLTDEELNTLSSPTPNWQLVHRILKGHFISLFDTGEPSFLYCHVEGAYRKALENHANYA